MAAARFRQPPKNENNIIEQTNERRCYVMARKQEKQNNVQPKKLEETKTGYGNKKLEGPDRPST
ncbi:hypothetical protein KIS4809_2473 [Bacillus sp. ZZV12-4809]|nr:hypothetical protein KIS4809_2473 [Bacillus sp. ZZV12-4809]